MTQYLTVYVFFIHRNKVYLIFSLVKTSEKMLVFLVRYLERHEPAGGKNELLTLLPLHHLAPGLQPHLAHGLADRLALSADHRDLLMLEDREEIEQGLGVRSTLPRLDLLRDDLLLEAAVLPRHVAAVVVAQPDLDPHLIHVPPGVALLLHHGLAYGDILDLRELLLGPGLTDLLRKLTDLGDVVRDGLGHGAVLAVHVALDLAVVDRDLNAGSLLPLDAPVCSPVATHLYKGLIKVQRSKS